MLIHCPIGPGSRHTFSFPASSSPMRSRSSKKMPPTPLCSFLPYGVTRKHAYVGKTELKPSQDLGQSSRSPRSSSNSQHRQNSSKVYISPCLERKIVGVLRYVGRVFNREGPKPTHLKSFSVRLAPEKHIQDCSINIAMWVSSIGSQTPNKADYIATRLMGMKK